MPTRSTRCEGCPDPPSNKLPLRDYDLHMPGAPIIVATLCPGCIAVDDGNNSDEKMRLRARVQLGRRQETHGRPAQADTQ